MCDRECRAMTLACLMGKDIGLLYLEEPIPISPYANLEAAAGWETFLIPDTDSPYGYTLESSPHCREVDIPMRAIEQGYCDTISADDRYEFCAGTWNHGTTGGDSGGPTMALINDKWYQHGVTSRGTYLQNDDPQMFRDQGIYTDVSSFCDWKLLKLLKEKFNANKQNRFL
uniref:Peptidase S1 domain-containing protein n=1 Tax=Panagrolaimus sp. JU765 TaxID=591449 RepID=A0AC34Q386_9BILA